MKKEELKKLVEEFPLSEAVEDTLMNKLELAAFFGVNRNTIDAWQREGMPFVSEGTNGLKWQFQLSHCFAWSENRSRVKIEGHLRNRAIIEAHNLSDTNEIPSGLSAKQMKELLEVQKALDDLRETRSNLVPRGDVQEGFEFIMAMFRDGVVSLSDRLEREVGLQGADLERVDEITDQWLNASEAHIERFFADRPVRKLFEPETEMDV